MYIFSSNICCNLCVHSQTWADTRVYYFFLYLAGLEQIAEELIGKDSMDRLFEPFKGRDIHPMFMTVHQWNVLQFIVLKVHSD